MTRPVRRPRREPRTPGSSAAHSALVRAILAELGTLPGVVIGANASGRALYIRTAGKRFHVPYGWLAPGGPDVLAVVAPLGRMVAFECKTGDAELTKEQRQVHDALRAVGVETVIVRAVEEAVAAIERSMRCGPSSNSCRDEQKTRP